MYLALFSYPLDCWHWNIIFDKNIFILIYLIYSFIMQKKKKKRLKMK